MRQEPDEEEDEEEDEGNGKEDGDDEDDEDDTEDDRNDDGYSERARIVTGSARHQHHDPTPFRQSHRINNRAMPGGT